MKSTRIAQRYAHALYELSGSLNLEERLVTDMEMLQRTIDGSRDLKKMLASPVIRADRKKAVMESLFSGHFHKATLGYISIIIRNKREIHLQGIAQKFIEIYRQDKGIITARLATAVPLSDTMVQSIRKLVAEQMKAVVELETSVRTELIGGYVLEVEGKRYDTSLRSKLNSLIREFNINIYEKKL